MNGTVKKINSEKGFGFIRGEDGKDYFFHRSALKNTRMDEIYEGQEMTFEGAMGGKGLRAEEVIAG
jgi:CspA family cold shock protein